jgi:hypothetical protein
MARWLAGFAERHGGAPEVVAEDGGLTLRAPDGDVAACFAPPGLPAPTTPGDLSTEASGLLGMLLARRGGFAVGLVDGERLVASKVDSRYVQSRTAAGGWSQQRFARRRDNQAKAAAGEAADECARILGPVAGELAAFVTGGDRAFVDSVLADARLASLHGLRAGRFLAVPDPKRAVLESAIKSARAVQIRLSQ